MALTQGLIDSYWRKYNQRRALTGLPSSYQEQRGMLDPIMESVANKDVQEAQLRFQNERANQQFALQQQQQKDAARAATVSGIAQTGGLLSTAYLTNKALTNQAATNKLLTSYLTPSAAPAVAVGAGSGGAPVLAGAGSGALTAPGPLSGSITGFTPAAPTLAAPTSFSGMGAEAGAAVPAVGPSSMLPGLGAAAGLYGLQQMSGPYVNKAIGGSMPMAAKGWQMAGLPGAATGATIDFGKKAVDEVSNFFSDTFGW